VSYIFSFTLVIKDNSQRSWDTCRNKR